MFDQRMEQEEEDENRSKQQSECSVRDNDRPEVGMVIQCPGHRLFFCRGEEDHVLLLLFPPSSLLQVSLLLLVMQVHPQVDDRIQTLCASFTALKSFFFSSVKCCVIDLPGSSISISSFFPLSVSLPLQDYDFTTSTQVAAA